MKPKTVAVLTIILLVLIVHIQNTQVVTLKLFFWSFPMSQIVLMLILLFLGFASGFIVAKITRKRLESVGPPQL